MQELSSLTGPEKDAASMWAWLKTEQLAVGQNQTTRIWTTGLGPCFHLPGFVGYLFLTRSQLRLRF